MLALHPVCLTGDQAFWMRCSHWLRSHDCCSFCLIMASMLALVPLVLMQLLHVISAHSHHRQLSSDSGHTVFLFCFLPCRGVHIAAFCAALLTTVFSSIANEASFAVCADLLLVQGRLRPSLGRAVPSIALSSMTVPACNSQPVQSFSLLLRCR